MKPCKILVLVFTLILSKAGAQVYAPGGTIGTALPAGTTNVGIGNSSSSPIAPLHIRFNGVGTDGNEIGLIIDRSGGSQLSTTPRGAAMAFRDGSNNSITAGVSGIRQNPNTTYNSDLAFFVANTGSVSSVSAFSQLTERMRIKANGNVGIGTDNPGSLLSVNGKIAATEVNVKVDVTVPDYVFEPDYDLIPLTDLEKYLAKNKHLPEVPSAAEMSVDGLNLKEMNLLLLKKVEEMTLYMIEMKKEIEVLKANQK